MKFWSARRDVLNDFFTQWQFDSSSPHNASINSARRLKPVNTRAQFRAFACYNYYSSQGT